MTHIDLTDRAREAAADPAIAASDRPALSASDRSALYAPDRSAHADERSLGELVATAAADMSALVRQEVALAKAEIAESVRSAGIGVGELGGAGVTALVGLLFLSLAAMFGLDAAGLPLYGAALVVASCWLLVAGVLGLLGTRKLGDVGGVPRTAKTLKEDVEWARHPSS